MVGTMSTFPLRNRPRTFRMVVPEGEERVSRWANWDYVHVRMSDRWMG